MSRFKDPAAYAGEFVCARCGSGWPCCTDTKPDGTLYTHEETCAKYEARDDWEDMNVCDKCEKSWHVSRQEKLDAYNALARELGVKEIAPYEVANARAKVELAELRRRRQVERPFTPKLRRKQSFIDRLLGR